MIGKFLAVLSVSLLMSFNSIAADSDGKFAVKGAGRKTCEQFVETAKLKNSDLYLYGGWIEGFVSAYNQHQPNTYDVTPWQTTELMLFLLQEHCKKHPETRFLTAVNGIFKALHPIALTKESPVSKVSVEDTHAYFYVDVIKQVQQRLTALDFYTGEIDGNYNNELVKALAKYQQKFGLSVTGYPDQQSLTHMFIKLRSPAK